MWENASGDRSVLRLVGSQHRRDYTWVQMTRAIGVAELFASEKKKEERAQGQTKQPNASMSGQDVDPVHMFLCCLFGFRRQVDILDEGLAHVAPEDKCIRWIDNGPA